MDAITTTTQDPVPDRTRPPSAPAGPGRGGPPDESAHDVGWSIHRAGATAGVCLLLMIVPALIGNFAAVEGLVTPGDAAATTADIAASEGLFRFGIVNLFLVVVLDVVVAWALYRVFRPVSAGVSMLAGACRLVYSGIFMVAISRLVGVVSLVGNDQLAELLGPRELQAQVLLGVDAYHDTWSAGLLLFGLHLLVVALLAYRSGFVPKVVAALLALAGAGYLFDSAAAVLMGDAAPTISVFTFPGEVLLAVWLIAWSRRASVA